MLEVRLTRGYFRSSRRLAPAGTPTAKKLASTLRTLANEPVPAATDEPDLLPPSLPCFVRPVAGTVLGVMFLRDGMVVKVLAVEITA